jgi:hypothetical protein
LHKTEDSDAYDTHLELVNSIKSKHQTRVEERERLSTLLEYGLYAEYAEQAERALEPMTPERIYANIQLHKIKSEPRPYSGDERPFEDVLKDVSHQMQRNIS